MQISKYEEERFLVASAGIFDTTRRIPYSRVISTYVRRRRRRVYNDETLIDFAFEMRPACVLFIQDASERIRASQRVIFGSVITRLCSRVILGVKGFAVLIVLLPVFGNVASAFAADDVRKFFRLYGHRRPHITQSVTFNLQMLYIYSRALKAKFS